MAERYDYLFKFIIIGDAATGKSCLLHRFIDNKFKENSAHTIGVEFGSKIIEVGGQKKSNFKFGIQQGRSAFAL